MNDGSQMAKVLFLVHGKPGSGKTTASALAAEQLGAYHFSIGDELRARALHGKPSQYSKELAPYAEQLKQHLPIPPHFVGLIFKECVATSPSEVIIVDGYPQYVDRLPTFEATLAETDAIVRAICVLEISDTIARQRIRDRNQRAADVVEDEAYITRRLDGFRNNVVPVLEALRHKYPVVELAAEQHIDAVTTDLVDAVRRMEYGEKL